MAIAALAVIGMLAVGIARMHESHATRVSPVDFFNGGKTSGTVDESVPASQASGGAMESRDPS